MNIHAIVAGGVVHAVPLSEESVQDFTPVWRERHTSTSTIFWSASSSCCCLSFVPVARYIFVTRQIYFTRSFDLGSGVSRTKTDRRGGLHSMEINNNAGCGSTLRCAKRFVSWCRCYCPLWEDIRFSTLSIYCSIVFILGRCLSEKDWDRRWVCIRKMVPVADINIRLCGIHAYVLRALWPVNRTVRQLGTCHRFMFKETKSIGSSVTEIRSQLKITVRGKRIEEDQNVTTWMKHISQ